ncbi:MAG: hypothetical protein LAO30_22245 [Acidobacteriia bacterium]|nr:hypothetical protein [Terriglobia bacterium]
MKYLIPVFIGGATITAAITTAVAQAHGAFIGNVSRTPYLVCYGVSAVLLLIAVVFGINAHRQESPHVVGTLLPLSASPPPAPADASRDYAISFVEGWAEDGILYVRVGTASGANVSNITAQISYYDSQGRPYRVMEGIWHESGQPLLEAMPTVGTMILAATTDGKTAFAPRPNTGVVDLKSGKGFIAIRLHFTLYGSQTCDLPPLLFSVRLGKQMSVSLTDSIPK